MKNLRLLARISIFSFVIALFSTFFSNVVSKHFIILYVIATALSVILFIWVCYRGKCPHCGANLFFLCEKSSVSQKYFNFICGDRFFRCENCNSTIDTVKNSVVLCGYRASNVENVNSTKEALKRRKKVRRNVP
jgi:hypothetical protein